MNFTIKREEILKPLQILNSVVERRQTMAILANILLVIDNENRLTMVATDLEVEITATIILTDAELGAEPGKVTISIQKFTEICRTLPEGSVVEVKQKGDRVMICSGKSRFNLATLPVEEFPKITTTANNVEFTIKQRDFKKVIGNTYFAMAQQDVRLYLNGLLIEVGDNILRAVATDGHRLSLCDVEVSNIDFAVEQVIIPRKGILELLRVFEDNDENIQISLQKNHIRVEMQNLQFISKLIDAKYPDYGRVLPQDIDKVIFADREILRQAFTRTSILSNEKYRGIRIFISNGELKAVANNPEFEEAEEVVDIEYEGESLEIGFNVNYIIDALSAIDSSQVEISFSGDSGGCLIQPRGRDDCKYVIMPMRL